MDGDDLTGEIIGAAIEIHRHLGPGLLESAYEECMVFELRKCGLQVSPRWHSRFFTKENG